MTELYSVQQQKAENGNVLDANELGGNVRVAYFEYTTTGTEAAADTLVLTTIPKACRILSGQLHIDAIDGTGDGATTATTVRVGDTGDDDRYLTATAADAADVDSELNAPASVGFGYETTASTEVVMTFDAVDAEADKTIKGYLLYVPQG